MLNTNDSKRQEIISVCVNVSEEGKVFCALLAKQTLKLILILIPPFRGLSLLSLKFT